MNINNNIDLLKRRSPKLLLEWFTNEPIHIEILSPQNPTREHAHDFDEIAFVLSGTGVHIVNGNKYYLMPGDLFVIKEGQSHKIEKPCNLYLVNVLYKWSNFDSCFKNYASALPVLNTLFFPDSQNEKQYEFKSRFHLAPWQLNEIVSKLDEMNKEEKVKLIGYKSIIKNIFETILLKICRFYTENYYVGLESNLEMNSVLDYINDHFNDNISIDGLVENSSMSRAIFYKTFKETTGLSPIDYIIKLRISRATEMMMKDDKFRIIDIAMKTGFENSAYFSRKFKQIIGVSPLKFKQEMHKDKITNYIENPSSDYSNYAK